MESPLFVTQPLLPDLSEFSALLEEIWAKKWLTNFGEFHNQLEKALAAYLGVEFLSLFTNGTLPLITALYALDIKGEVITTPYSFVATTHALWWNGLKPVFVDVEENTGNMDPSKIQAAITPNTAAILPVHVYGTPCDVQAIEQIAQHNHLKVIYDAAHAFGVKQNGSSILNAGDMATLSFHATKVFNTIEGGALVCRDEKTKKYIDQLKNFGFVDEITVDAPGINSKMDEVRAAFGLLNLKKIDAAISNRQKITQYYQNAFKNTEGIRFLNQKENTQYNYAYFPIFINEKIVGKTRDEVYFYLKENHIMARRYFYPLISYFPMYRHLESAQHLPVAQKLAKEVLCLPIYADLNLNDAERVVQTIKKCLFN